MTVRERWHSFWYAPTPALRFDLLRQALLYSLAVYLWVRWQHVDEWLTPAGFHPSAAADPRHSPGVALLSPGLVPWFGVALFASLTAAILGWQRRLATGLVLAGVLYVTAADPIAAFTLNRLYIFSLVVFLVAPAATPSPTGPMMVAWPVRAFQLTLVTHYFASGLCKSLHGDWLHYSDVLWLQIQGLYMTDAAAWLVRTLPAWLFTGQQHLALAFELLAPLLLGIRRLRPLGFVIGLGLHIVVAITMHQLIYFSLQMMCFYIVFLDPEALARWTAWWRRDGRAEIDPAGVTP